MERATTQNARLVVAGVWPLPATRPRSLWPPAGNGSGTWRHHSWCWPGELLDFGSLLQRRGVIVQPVLYVEREQAHTVNDGSTSRGPRVWPSDGLEPVGLPKVTSGK